MMTLVGALSVGMVGLSVEQSTGQGAVSQGGRGGYDVWTHGPWMGIGVKF